MITFSVLGFPVRVQPWFFLTAFLVGPRWGGPLRIAIWIVVVFVGVLLHELGHAWVGRRFGLVPFIELHGLGGQTGWMGGPSLSPLRQVVVSAAGPGAGALVGIGALVLSRSLQPPPGTALTDLLSDLVWVNLGWAVLNLVPIVPLDGGAIMASLAEAVWGERGRRAAHVLSLGLAVLAAVWALASRQWWLALITGLLAASNFQALRGGARRRVLPASRRDHRPVLERLAAAFNRQEWGEVVAAAEELLAAADTDELRAHALYYLAWGRLERGDVRGARQAASAMPAGIGTDAALEGSLLLAEGQPEAAVSCLEAGLVESGDPAIAARWVEAVRSSGAFERAAELLRAGGARRLGRENLTRLVEVACQAGAAAPIASALLERRPDPALALPLARALARSGERELAMSWLELAVRGGLADRALLDTDPELEGLRGLARFAALRERARG